MKLHKLLIVASVFVMIFTAASTLIARSNCGLHPMAWTALVDDLDLMEGQKEQVEAIVKKYEGNRDTLVKSLKKAREQLSTVIFSEEFIENDVREAYDAISSIVEELVVSRAQMIAELRTVLSLEQIGYLKGQVEERKKLPRHRRHGCRY